MSLFDQSSMPEQRAGTMLDFAIGLFLGWFFGLLAICCLFGFSARGGVSQKFKNGIMLGIGFKFLYGMYMLTTQMNR